MKTRYITIFLIALVLVSSACNGTNKNENSSKKSDNSANTTVKSETQKTIPTVQAKKVSFVIDDTGSSSDEQLQQPTDYSKTALAESENVKSIDIFNVGGNGKQSPEAIRQHFDIPVKPVNKFNETEAIELAKKNGCGNRLACINREVENIRKQSDIAYQNELAAYFETRNNLISKVGEAILQSSTKTPVCSDIQEQAELVAQSPSDIVIWFTDGQHNCKTEFKGIEFKNKLVLIGVLPIKNEVPGGFGKRFSELSAKFHNAQVKSVTSINKDVVRDFLAQ